MRQNRPVTERQNGTERSDMCRRHPVSLLDLPPELLTLVVPLDVPSSAATSACCRALHQASQNGAVQHGLLESLAVSSIELVRIGDRDEGIDIIEAPGDASAALRMCSRMCIQH